MHYAEEDFVPISALQHLLFCPRQCALIHNEQSWLKNRLTAEGQVLHRNAERGKATTRNNIRITRDLPLHSHHWGLVGKADIVEFHPPPDTSPAAARRTLKQRIDQQRERSLAGWTIIPVEYKRGQPKKDDSDRVQLCAQALCLEEMLQVEITHGYLFYGKKQHRHDVPFDDELRDVTAHTIRDLHTLFESGRTPPATYEPKCNNCSLYDLCLPKMFQTNSAESWLNDQL